MRISDWSSDLCSSDLAARRQREDRIFVAGPTAKKAVAVILDDDQRELLARRAIWRQHEIAPSRQPEIVAPGQPFGSADPQPREFRFGGVTQRPGSRDRNGPRDAARRAPTLARAHDRNRRGAHNE